MKQGFNYGSANVLLCPGLRWGGRLLTRSRLCLLGCKYGEGTSDRIALKSPWAQVRGSSDQIVLMSPRGNGVSAHMVVEKEKEVRPMHSRLLQKRPAFLLQCLASGTTDHT